MYDFNNTRRLHPRFTINLHWNCFICDGDLHWATLNLQYNNVVQIKVHTIKWNKGLADYIMIPSWQGRMEGEMILKKIIKMILMSIQDNKRDENLLTPDHVVAV